MKPHKPSYTVTKTEDFIKKCQVIRKEFDRFNDLIDAVVWALERKPHFYSQVSGDYYVLVSDALADSSFPSVKILYKIFPDEYRVTLLEIE